jgi:hypothetical protein
MAKLRPILFIVVISLVGVWLANNVSIVRNIVGPKAPAA